MYRLILAAVTEPMTAPPLPSSHPLHWEAERLYCLLQIATARAIREKSPQTRRLMALCARAARRRLRRQINAPCEVCRRRPACDSVGDPGARTYAVVCLTCAPLAAEDLAAAEEYQPF